MDLRKPRNGEWIALASGIALIVALFLPWYGADGDSMSGWASLSVFDLVLCACALLGIAQWFFTVQQPTPAVPLAVAGLGVWIGAIATILVLIRIVDVPADGLGLQLGVFVALAATIGLAVGAWRGLGDERLRRPDGSWSRPSHGEVGAGVDVKTLPPPRAGAGASGNS